MDLDFVPTPAEAAEYILQFANLTPLEPVLEPSAGEGNLAKVIRGAGHPVTCGELDPLLAEALRREGFPVSEGDFLTKRGKDFGSFRHILMTPPFGSGLYQKHVAHAYDLLEEGGILVSLLPQGIPSTFKAWGDQVGVVERVMPSGSFPASKTNVETLLWRIVK